MGREVADRAQEAGSSVVELVRRHPLPAALIGAGIALLVAGGGVGVRERQRDEPGDEDFTAYGSRYGYGEGAYSAGDFSSAKSDYSAQSDYGRETSAGYPNTEYAPRRYGGGREFESYGAYDSGYDTGESESTGRSRGVPTGASWSPEQSEAREDSSVESTLTTFVKAQPLIAGLVTLVLGALFGLLFPSSKREDELMGGARDHLAEQAKDAAERARAVAQKTFEEVRDTAKEEFEKLGTEAKEDGEELLEKGKAAAKKVADNAKETAKAEADKAAPKAS
jgi:hypothetical protein